MKGDAAHIRDGVPDQDADDVEQQVANSNLPSLWQNITTSTACASVQSIIFTYTVEVALQLESSVGSPDACRRVQTDKSKYGKGKFNDTTIRANVRLHRRT